MARRAVLALLAVLLVAPLLAPFALTGFNEVRRWAAVREMRALVEEEGDIVGGGVRWDRGMTGQCFAVFDYRVRLEAPADEALRRLEARAEAENVEVVSHNGGIHVVHVYKHVGGARWDMGCA